jgi:hypothetical protein
MMILGTILFNSHDDGFNYILANWCIDAFQLRRRVSYCSVVGVIPRKQSTVFAIAYLKGPSNVAKPLEVRQF